MDASGTDMIAICSVGQRLEANFEQGKSLEMLKETGRQLAHSFRADGVS